MRQSENYLICLGDLRDAQANIIFEIEGKKIILLSVMIDFVEPNGRKKELDVVGMLTMSAETEIKDYLKRLYVPREAIVDWNSPDGAA